MAYPDDTQNGAPTQDDQGRSLEELAQIFDAIDASAVLERLQAYRPTGRRGYPLRALWRAYVAAYYYNLEATNDLIRKLEDEWPLRIICGFAALPHRTTFNRFWHRLSHHADLVEEAFTGVTDALRTYLPDLGKVVAVDSTAVKSASQPNRKVVSDPDARWGVKHSAKAKKDDKMWFFGYKLHMVADVNHGIPLAQVVTPGNRNDTRYLPTLYEQGEKLYDWWKPEVMIADRGYDSNRNHNYLDSNSVIPIIHIRKPSNTKYYDGLYTHQGVPVCMGMEPMEYIQTDPDTGFHQYRCQSGGCHLKDSRQGGILHCDSVVWEDPSTNIRLFGKIRRGSKRWKAYYKLRQGIERVFKSEKQSRRLEYHRWRSFLTITLHCMMSTMVFQATALTHAQAGQMEWLRWQKRKVA